MNERFFLIVSLWLKNNNVVAFEAFEYQASMEMAKYDGRIERAIRIAGAGNDNDKPFEVHLVSFPNESAFQEYRQSPESQKLAGARATIFAKTVTHTGNEVTAYGGRRPLKKHSQN